MMLAGRKWRNALACVGLTGGVIVVSACGSLDLNQLIPSTTIDLVSDDNTLQQFVINSCPQSVVARLFAKHQALRKNTEKVRYVLPPELSSHPVVTALIDQSHYVSARALQSAAKVLKNAPEPPPTPTPPSSVSPLAVYDFGKVVIERVFRHTPGAIANPDPVTEKFWTNLKAYYAYFFKNKFITYLGQPLNKPTASLTITDTEIVQTTQVFVELLLDEIFESPVWAAKDSSKNTVYYPGGSKNRPTYLVVNTDVALAQPNPLPSSYGGCGMNVPKAEAVDNLVAQFSTAATGEVGLLVKSVGGIEIGLGILGKLNIGDNNLVSELAKGVTTELVSRLTVELAVPILSAIDFKQQQQQPIVANVQVPGPKSAAAAKAQQTRMLTTPFISASVKPL